MIIGYSCDSCGVRIEADRSILSIKSGPLRTALKDKPLRALHPNIDLCAECARKVENLILADPPASPRSA